MGKVLKARDIASGQEGTAYMEINGRNVELFYLKNITATMEKTKATAKTLGHRGTQHKATGFEITGSMSIYSVTSDFIVLMKKYKDTGEDWYFNIKVTNEDKTTTIGTQSTLLIDCNVDSTVIAQLDVDEDFLSQDIDFTAEDYDIMGTYNEPSSYR